LWYHRQAYRDDTRELLYSLAPSNASDDAIPIDACVELIGGGGRKRALEKERNGVQTIEIQRGISANQESDLPGRQRLIFDRHDEFPVKEGFDKVLTEDGIPLDSQRVPGNRFGHNRRSHEACLLSIYHSAHFQRLRRKIVHCRIEVRGILHSKYESAHSRRSTDGKSHPDRHIGIFILKPVGDDQTVTGDSLAR